MNRCQEDILHGRSIRDALASEAAFFQSRPEYACVASRCSTAALSHTVSSILAQHIQNLLPSLHEAIGAPPPSAGLFCSSLTRALPHSEQA